MEEKARKVTYQEILSKTAENYQHLSCSIAKQLQFATPHHQLTTGTYRERIWGNLFQQLIPKKYQICQGAFIIDAFGNMSGEVDLAIIDEYYMPYIFNYGNIKFIPIEAVAAVVQSKSNSFDGIADWVAAINELQTDFRGVARFATRLLDYRNKTKVEERFETTTQSSTRPIKILCSLKKAPKSCYKDFDILLSANDINFGIKKVIPKEDWTLREWSNELVHCRLDSKHYKGDMRMKMLYDHQNGPDQKNEAESSDPLLKNLAIYTYDQGGEQKEEVVLLSLMQQLNQLLMVINNPLLFPHLSYTEAFNRSLESMAKSKTKENGNE